MLKCWEKALHNFITGGLIKLGTRNLGTPY
jgi:hypothetical protein